MIEYSPLSEEPYLEETASTLASQLETWSPVRGYEGRYEVSDQGRVRSLNYRHKGIVVVMSQAMDRYGYMRLAFNRSNVRVHSLVAEAFLGPRPLGYDVNHKNGIKHDNRLENLEFSTEAQNTQHSYKFGLQVAAHGEKHYRTKLTEKDVCNIVRLANAGIPQKEIALRFGIKQQAVSKMKTGVSWKCVSRKEEL